MLLVLDLVSYCRPHAATYTVYVNCRLSLFISHISFLASIFRSSNVFWNPFVVEFMMVFLRILARRLMINAETP